MTPKDHRNIHTTGNTVAVETHFHTNHDTQKTLHFCMLMEKPLGLLFLSSVSLLSGDMVLPEKNY